MIDALEAHDMLCYGASDIEPQRSDIDQYNAFDIKSTVAEMFITNPPWDRKILHPLICNLRVVAPTWLLFDADWAHTLQATDLGKYCRKIVSVGRISWMGNGVSGVDNCAWYLFDRPEYTTEYHWRVKK